MLPQARAAPEREAGVKGQGQAWLRLRAWCPEMPGVWGRQSPGSQAGDQSSWNGQLMRQGGRVYLGRPCGQGRDVKDPTPGSGARARPQTAMQLDGSHRAARE